MHDSKVARLIATFEKRERSGIERYLEHAGFEPHSPLRQLFAYLSTPPGKTTKDTFTPEFLKGILDMPAEDPSTNPKLNLLLHQLKHQIEDYLVMETVKNDEAERSKILLRAYRKRRASEFLIDTATRVEKQLEHVPKGVAYFGLYSEMVTTFFNHPYPNQFSKRRFSIQDVLKAADYQWYSVRVTHLWNCLLEGFQFTAISPAMREDAAHMLQLYDKDPNLQTSPFVTTYIIAIRDIAAGSTSVEHFREMRANVEAFVPNAIHDEIMGLMNLLINYLYVLQLGSQISYYDDLLDLYQMGLDNGGLYKDGYLSYADFINMVNIACRLKRFDWVTQVIDNYGNRINPQQKDGILKMVYARIAFFKDNPAEALRILNQKKHGLNDAEKLYEKLLRSYCYHDLGEYDLLEAHLEAFRKFIGRASRFNANLRVPIQNFIKFLRRHMLATEPQQLQALLEDLKPMPNLYVYEWLKVKAQAKLDSLS